MNSQLTTKAIVLRRTNYQEADRILTVLSELHGKMSIIAKGVRKSKSKLAGGIELFAVNDLSVIKGKSELFTLTSSRVKAQFGNIVKDIDRTMKAYEYLKLIDKIVDDHADTNEYFDVLACGLEGLNNLALDHHLVDVWFYIHVLDISGARPNLKQDSNAATLEEGKTYNFDVADMQFAPAQNGVFSAKHIKLLRFALAENSTKRLPNLRSDPAIGVSCSRLCKSMVEHNLL